jgi:hypothetical protein
MPASADTLNRYDAAVRGLAGAFADLGALAVVAEEEHPAGADTHLDAAVDSYVAESWALFEETVEADPRAALASLGGDFRALVELGTAAEGPDLTAGLTAADSDGSDAGAFAADMALVRAVASGAEPPPAPMLLADTGDPASGALASIDAIVAAGKAKLQAAAVAAILPSVPELGTVVGRLLGPRAGTGFATALQALRGWQDRIVRAATKLLQAAVDKVAALLGGTVAHQLQEWLQAILDPAAVYAAVLGVPRLRDRAKNVLATAPDARERAARIAAVAEAHDRDQRWVGWGAKALSWAGPKLHSMLPWGPPVVGLVSVALVVMCAWLTEDHLDSYDLAWLPDRVRGVNTALA